MAHMSKRKIHLILDFDGTIVKNNTIPLLDYLRQDKFGVSYSSFIEPYMRDYHEHEKSYRPVSADRTTIELEYAYLESLKDIERSSIARIEASGWLKGLKWNSHDSSPFRYVAARISADKPLNWRAGFVEIVQAVFRDDGRVHILSVNWSSQFIRSLIMDKFGTLIDVNRIRIYSNEIDPSGTGRLSRMGTIAGEDVEVFWPEPGSAEYNPACGIWTANDKARVMKSIANTSEADAATCIYIGDSKTDLRCIMNADIGICIREDEDPSEEQSGLAKVLNRLSIEQKSIAQWSDITRASKCSTTVLWYAKDFSAVHDALFRTCKDKSH